MRVLFGSEYYQELKRLFSVAEKSVLVVSFLFRERSHFGKDIIELLRSLVVRGVQVYYVLNSQLAANTSVRQVDNLVRRFNSLGIHAFKWHTSAVCHAKVVVVDQRYCLIGSHNISDRAITRNIEISVSFENEREAQRIFDYFVNNDYRSSFRHNQADFFRQVQKIQERIQTKK